MFFDLDVPWTPNKPSFQNTLDFLDELGYNVVALSHTFSGKLPTDLSCQIPSPLPHVVPAKICILRRCTLVLSDPTQNHRLSSLANSYDLLALRPTNERALQLACESAACDIISLDMTVRHDFHLRMKMLTQAVERGIKFEICYSSGIMATDSNARRNLISNASQLIRATRGRGLIISSGAETASGCRAPWDVINLAAVWGLGSEKGKEAISKLARVTVAQAQMKRTSFRGVVDVVYGGDGSEAAKVSGKASESGQKKRKATHNESHETHTSPVAATLSKREQKRRKKAQAALQTDVSTTPTRNLEQSNVSD